MLQKKYQYLLKQKAKKPNKNYNFQNLLLTKQKLYNIITELKKQNQHRMTTLNKQPNLQQWLQSINCIESFTQNDILNGMLINNIITHISSNFSPALKQLSTSTSMLSRVTNWNILSEELKKFNINLNQDQRNKIINGNQQAVIEIVSQLKEFHSKKEKSSEVDLTQVDPKKDPNQAGSLLELLLVLMMKNFHLSAKEAVALLSNQSKYLAHILTKGLKGQFKGIESFLADMYKCIEKITQFCKINKQNVVFLLRSIKPALISKSEQVSSACLQFFNKFLLHYNPQQRLSVFETHLLSTYILAIKRHSHMEVQVIVSMLDTICGLTIQKDKPSKGGNKAVAKDFDNKERSKMRTKVMEYLWSALGSESEKYSMILVILRTFGELDKIEEFLSLEFFAKKLQKAVETIKQQQHSLACIDIVLMINQYVPEFFSQQQETQMQQKFHINPSQLAQNLVQNLQSLEFPSHPIPLSTQIFTLLHNFGQQKHFIAPSLYKMLVEKFTEVQDINSDIYQVYLQNFIETIREFPSIPWQGVFQIVIGRKKETTQGVEMNEIELQFFYFLLGLENIDIKTSLVIYDVVSKTFMQTYHLAGHITKLIVKIVDLFAKTEPIVEQLTLKLIKVCLAIHHANIKKMSHKRKSLTGNTKLSDEQALGKIKNNSIEFLILKLAQLRIPQINSKVEPLVAFSYIQMKEKSQLVKGFKNILLILGNFNQIVQKYEAQIKKVEEQAKQQHKLQKQKQKQKQRMSASKIVSKVNSKSRYDAQNIESVRQDLSFAEDNPQYYLSQNKGQSISLHNNSFNRSYLGVTPSAQKGIEKFQKVYLSKIQKQDFEKIRKQEEQERFEMMKKLYRKKMMSHGIQMKGQTDNIQYLYQFDSQDNLIFEKHFLRIPYYTNETEEDRDMMAVERLLKSYQKVLKFIFNQYSGHKKGEIPQNFDEIAQKNVFVSSSGLYKFLKDFGFEDYVTLKEVQYLTQKINIELNPQTSDFQILEPDGFIEFIKQVSFLMFTRPPKDLRGHPLTMMLEETFSNLRLFAAQNKINEQIFEDPANIFFNETEAVAELNRKLAKNPDYILPEGYKKIVEKKISFEYGIFLQALSPTYKVVFEVVDWLLNKALDVHVLEPFTKEQKVTKARPALFVAQRLKIDSMLTKHIPTSLKKQITKIPIKSRPDAKECAIVLDQIITAIELGHATLGQKHFNKVEIERKQQQQEEKKVLQVQKRRRQNRNRNVKSAIEEYNQKKQEKQKQLSQKKVEEQKRVKEEKQKKEKQQKELKRKLQQYNKKKKQEQEQKMKKKKQQQQRQKKQRQKLKQLNQQSKKKLQEQKKKKQQEEAAKKAQKQREEKRLKELEKKKLHESQLIKKKMVEEFKLRKSGVRDSNSAKKNLQEQKKNLESLQDKEQ